MKRKLLWVSATLIMVVAFVFCFTACGGGSGETGTDGTYYLYENSTLDKSQYINLDGTTWSDESGDTGSLEITGTDIILYTGSSNGQTAFASGTVKNGVLSLDIMGHYTVFCKEGKTPSENIETSQKYTVTYDANGGKFKNEQTIITQSNIPSGTLLTAPEFPEKNNFNFSGWAKDRSGSELWLFDSDRVTANITLYAVWEEKSGIIVSVEGASIDGRNIFMFSDPATDSISLSSKVVCSGDSTWKLYYDKLGQIEIPTKIAAGQSGTLENGNNIFYIVVTSKDGTQVNTYQLTVHRSYLTSAAYYDGNELIKTENVYTGSVFTTDFTPSIKGYKFNGWKTENGEVFTQATVLGPFSLYADKTAKDYKLTLDKNGGEELTQKEFTVTFDSQYKLPVPEREGYTFNGWYDEGTKLTDSDGHSIYAWTYDINMTLTAKWEANLYDVELNKNDNSAGNVTGAGKHPYESEVTITAHTNTGYTWLGWYDQNDQLVTLDQSYTFKMNFGVSYTAKWTYYTLTTSLNDPTAGTISVYTEEKVTAGDRVSLTAESNNGYIFSGWYDDEDYLLSDEYVYSFSMPSRNLTCTAKWSKITVTRNISEAGSTTAVDGKYKTGDEISVTADTNLGYNWLGWYDQTTFLTDSLTYTLTATSDDVNLTATWGISAEMSNFEFTSTKTDCTITGIIDNSVSEITVPDYVVSIELGAFSECISLTDLTLPFTGPDRDNTDFLPFGYIFGAERFDQNPDCVPSSLKTVTLTEETVIQSRTFDGCSFLSTVNLPDCLTNIGFAAFEGCASLMTVTIPENVTGIESSAFKDCMKLAVVYNLSSLDIVKGSSEYGGVAYYAFKICSSTDEDDDIFVTDDGFIFYSDQTVSSLINYEGDSAEVTLPDKFNGENYDINQYAFYNCEKITEISIPACVGKIGYGAFGNCISLTRISIPDSVSDIDSNIFAGCSSLESLTLPFVGDCIKTADSDNQYPLGYLFGKNYYENAVLTKQTYYSTPDKTISISYYIPSALKNITVTGGNILYGAFQNVSSLKSVTLPTGITSIGSYAFSNCKSLTDIIIPDSVTEIGNYSFANCTSLTTISIPDNVTKIKSSAFMFCESLTEIFIPQSVVMIDKEAFSECTNLTKVTFENPEGWWRCSIIIDTSGTDIPSDLLSNPSSAATCLTSDYATFFWRRGQV